MGMYKISMARASTTSDPFNAIAEPRRRHILEFLADEERSVGGSVTLLGSRKKLVPALVRFPLIVRQTLLRASRL